MILLDTNFIIGLFKKDNNPTQLVNTIDKSIEFVIPFIVAGEFLVNFNNINIPLKFLLNLSDSFEEVHIKDFELFNEINPKRRRSIKSNDCLIVAIARRKKAKILTFDKKMIKLANENGVQTIPQ